MRQRAMRAGAGNRLEGEVVEAAEILTEAFELQRRIDLRHLAGLGFGVEPVQEARQGGAVADMGRFGALDLRLVLAGLGQQDRVRRCAGRQGRAAAEEEL